MSKQIINQDAAQTWLTQKLPIPYPAALVVFVGLIIVNANNLAALVDFALKKIFAISSSTSALLGLGQSVEGLSVLIQSGLLIVGIPTMLLLAKVLVAHEANQPERKSQKLRRVVYVIGATLLLISLISILAKLVISLLMAGVSSNAGALILQALITNTISLIVIGSALYGLVNFYRGENLATVRTICLAGVIAAAILVPFALYKIYTQPELLRMKSSSRSYDSSRQLPGYPSSRSGGSWTDL